MACTIAWHMFSSTPDESAEENNWLHVLFVGIRHNKCFTSCHENEKASEFMMLPSYGCVSFMPTDYMVISSQRTRPKTLDFWIQLPVNISCAHTAPGLPEDLKRWLFLVSMVRLIELSDSSINLHTCTMYACQSQWNGVIYHFHVHGRVDTKQRMWRRTTSTTYYALLMLVELLDVISWTTSGNYPETPTDKHPSHCLNSPIKRASEQARSWVTHSANNMHS